MMQNEKREKILNELNLRFLYKYVKIVISLYLGGILCFATMFLTHARTAQISVLVAVKYGFMNPSLAQTTLLKSKTNSRKKTEECLEKSLF